MKDNTENATNFSELKVSVVLSALPIGLSLALIYLLREVNILSIFLFVLSIIITFSISVYCALSVYKNRLLHIYKEHSIHSVFLGRYKVLAKEGCGGIPMIERADTVAEYEKKSNFDEIWLVSNDLSTEVNDGVYAGTVIHNLKRGIKYKYFIPANDINFVRIRQLKAESDNNPNLEFYYLRNDFFFLAPDFDFAIYEPSKSRSDGRLSYMGLQLPNSDILYEVQMDDRLTGSIIENLSAIMKDSKPV